MPYKVSVVNRTFYFKERNGRISTISYTYNRDTKELKYGAVMYRPPKMETDEKHKTCFDKKKHLETSMERLKKCPVVVKDFVDDSNMENFHCKMRKLLYGNGVHGPRDPVLQAQEKTERKVRKEEHMKKMSEQKALKPKQEKKLEKPKEEMKSEKPKEEKKTDKSKEEKKTDKPKEEKKSDKPKEEKKSDKPKEEKKSEKSKEEKKSEKSKEELIELSQEDTIELTKEDTEEKPKEDKKKKKGSLKDKFLGKKSPSKSKVK